MLGGYEFYTLMRMGGFQPARLLGMVWMFLLILSWWQPDYLPILPLLTFGFIATLTFTLYQTQQPLLNWMITATGAIYIGVMLGQAIPLRLLPDGLWWTFFALLITWANDTFAYFVGVWIGRHKLWPRLSPKKSWEGTIAGWIFATLVGVLFVSVTPINATPLVGALIGFGGGLMALFGDLSISMLKRQVGAKDSGALMPGHGGMLDRLDSLLYVIPFVYQVALLIQ
jgi:phosphatidate cytidylyltransferase